MNTIIITIACAALVVIAWRSRPWAIAVVVALLPTYVVRTTVAGIPATMLEGLILTLFAVFCVRVIFFGEWREWIAELRQNRSQRFVIASGLVLICIGVLSLLATPDLHAGIGIFKAYLVEPVLFAVVCLASLKTQHDIQRVFWALAFSAAVIALIALVQYATGWAIPDPWNAWPGRRSTGVYGFPNAVGLYLAPIVSLCVGVLLFWEKRSLRVTAALCAVVVLSVAAIFSARADGAVIAIAAATFVLLLFTRFRWHACVAAIVLSTAAFAFEPTRDILLFHDASGDVRLALWHGTWNLLRAQPIFGAGLGAFPMVYDLYRLPSHVELLQYPHNLFLDFWVELGFAGLVWIAAMLGWLVSRTVALRQSARTHALPVLGVIVAFVVYGLVDVPYFKNDLALLFWLLIAVTGLFSLQKK